MQCTVIGRAQGGHSGATPILGPGNVRFRNAHVAERNDMGKAHMCAHSGLSYLFSTERMSWSTVCSEYVLLSAGCPCADPNAPLATIELVAACFRFAMDGDVGAGGRAGGVRVPLAAMMMVQRAIRDARDVVGVERAQAAKVVASSLSASPTFPATREGLSGLQRRERDHGTVDCDP
jgi:hypothetical protein